MKATMSAAGVLTVFPETECEAYAIGKWAQDALATTGDMPAGEQCCFRGSKLIVTSRIAQEMTHD